MPNKSNLLVYVTDESSYAAFASCAYEYDNQTEDYVVVKSIYQAAEGSAVGFGADGKHGDAVSCHTTGNAPEACKWEAFDYNTAPAIDALAKKRK